MIKKSQKCQCVLLLYTAAADASIVGDSSERYQDEKTCQAMLEIFQQNCVGDQNAIHARYKFNTRCQLTGETFDFYTDLRASANKCAFDYKPRDTDESSPLDKILRNMVVLDIKNDR